MCQINVEIHKSFLKETDEPISRVSIADPSIADVNVITPTQVLILAKKEIGRTNLIIWHGDERALVYEVNVYAPGNIAELIQEKLKQLAPEADVTVISSTKGVILDGQVESQVMLNRVIEIVKTLIPTFTNLITVKGTQQVQLDVRIAEVSRTALKRIGLGFLINKSWSVGIFPNGSTSGVMDATGINVKGQPEVTLRELNSLTELVSPFSSAFQAVVHSLNNDFLAILSILKSQGLARFLASPTLVTMTGQEADFLAGGEFPVPVRGNEGETTIEYKEFGIMLRFTPFVTGKEDITLKIEPEASVLDFSIGTQSGGVVVPGLRTRRGSTTLQLKDGQTFAMAGLLRENINTLVDKIPFLGDIPVIGTLFTSKEYQKEESELVIIVTPRLVRALNLDEVPELPGEDILNNVNDFDFFILNRMYMETTSERKTKEKKPFFIGDFGFSK